MSSDTTSANLRDVANLLMTLSNGGDLVPTADESAYRISARKLHALADQWDRDEAGEVPTQVCRYCGEQITYQRPEGWVCVRSGDDGGTFDICPMAPPIDDWGGRHQPEPKGV